MRLWPELYGLFLVLIVVPAAALARIAWRKRDKPGGRWLVLVLFGMSGWSASWGLLLLVARPAFSEVSFRALLFFVNVAAIGWLMLTLEFSSQRQYPLHYVLPLFVIPVTTQLVAITNPSHMLLWGPETVINSNGVIDPDHGPWFAVHAGFNYLLMLSSGVLLANDYVTFDGIYRKQAAVLLAGWVIPVITSLAFTFGVFPYDFLNPTPVGFLVGAAIWAWGLYRLQLFEIVPLARRRAIDEMDEAVIAINENNVVADVNPAARTLFELADGVSGTRLEDLLAEYPEVIEAVSSEAGETETTIVRSGQTCHLEISKSVLDEGGATGGSVIVFKDVSQLRRHERDLELLKEVLARVFRHDIGNDLNVIRAHGELLSNKLDDAGREHARTIVRNCDDIIETSRKARAIEKLVDDERDRYEIDLLHVVTEVAQWAEETFEDASVELDLPDESFVVADQELELAVRCLVDNALLHNDSPRPWVKIAVENDADTVTLVVTDDGPGIEDGEREVFEKRRIDQLSHSNGLGLWTVNWVVRNSGGHAHLEVTERGTKAILELERSQPGVATSTTERA